MEHILLVEDDGQLSFVMKRLLESKGYQVTAAASAAAAKEAMGKERFDLILLDMMLPDGEGTGLCAEIRLSSVCPVIFLSCLSDSDSKIAALRAGGDDYITKPVNFEELAMRIQANIRRAKEYNTGAREAEEISFPGLLLRKKKREAWLMEPDGVSGSLLELSPIE